MNKPFHVALAIAGVVGLCLTSSRVGAQATTQSPFHVGQWGIEGNAYGTTGGILRFLTPKTALVLDVGGSRTTSYDMGPFAGITSKVTSALLFTSLGVRRHSMIAPHVATTFGVGASFVSSRRHQDGGGSFHMDAYGAGVSVGGQYLVSDHYGIGLGYGLSANVRRDRSVNVKGSEISSSFEPLYAAIYF